MEYYVNANAVRQGDGTREKPFKRIQQAADIARAEDIVLVLPGIYREHVNPVNSGIDDKRIIYKSVQIHKAVIKGSEPVKSWQEIDEGIWMARIPDRVFTEENPFNVYFNGAASGNKHAGDVFLNEKAMFEVTDIEKVRHPDQIVGLQNSEMSVYTWYVGQDSMSGDTVIYANFHDFDPNRENVEISVRQSCFYAKQEGINDITLSGFKIMQAATIKCPDALVGSNLAYSWIIEDCDISEAGTNGISLGRCQKTVIDKKYNESDNKVGESRVGHHIIRRCVIHDCGLTAIIGQLGGVFSVLDNNIIYNINGWQNAAGDIAGVRLSGAVNCVLRKNQVYNCARAVWLDWQSQGARVMYNLLHDNGEDLFFEVAHGSLLLDNNIFLSEHSLKLPQDGVAFVHNLVAGEIIYHYVEPVNSKIFFTPDHTLYHNAHRTEVAGFMSISCVVNRIYNNIFMSMKIDEKSNVGIACFDKCESQIMTGGNVYFNGAKPYCNEQDFFEDKEHIVEMSIEKNGGSLYIKSNLSELMPDIKRTEITLELLGITFNPKEAPENPDAQPFTINRDFMGVVRGKSPQAGPFERIKEEINR